MTTAQDPQINEAIAAKCESVPEWATIPRQKREKILRAICHSCYNAAVSLCGSITTKSVFLNRYSEVSARVMYNITSIIHRIIANDIKAFEVGLLTSESLDPEASRAERELLEKRLHIKVQVKVSHEYICKKCGKNETTTIRYQARAADEPDSCSIKCINCGAIWRM